MLPIASQAALQTFIHETVSKKAELLATDAHPAYASLLGYPQHQIVNHNKGEYRKGNAHTNSIESVWALLKSASIIGFRRSIWTATLPRWRGA